MASQVTICHFSFKYGPCPRDKKYLPRFQSKQFRKRGDTCIGRWKDLTSLKAENSPRFDLQTVPFELEMFFGSSASCYCRSLAELLGGKHTQTNIKIRKKINRLQSKVLHKYISIGILFFDFVLRAISYEV